MQISNPEQQNPGMLTLLPGDSIFSFYSHLYVHLLEFGGVHNIVCLLLDVEASDPPVELVDIVGLLSAGLL